MRRDDAENVEIWAARPEVWAEESNQVKIKYGAAVEAARKAMAKDEQAAPKKKVSAKKKEESNTEE
jgi:hypothetical protein